MKTNFKIRKEEMTIVKTMKINSQNTSKDKDNDHKK